MTRDGARILFLNPPHAAMISRRYMCSYFSPLFLHPPHDLLQLATCAREWNGAEVRVLDAIAKKMDTAAVTEEMGRFRPDVVVAIVGVETIGDDLDCLARLKAQASPDTIFAIFGYYATVFAAEIVGNTPLDLVLRGEPERPLSEWLAARADGGAVDAIDGLAGRRAEGGVFCNPVRRIEDLASLPLPDYTAIPIGDYEEGLMGGPCGAILTARGCPFGCSCCTTTFGRKTVFKPPELVVKEFQALEKAGARVVRVLDDTFALNRDRVVAICRGLVEAGVSLRWACLARADALDPELLDWMRRAGCERVLVGVESYSQKVLDYLNKQVRAETVNDALWRIHRAGMEVVGFFLTGIPGETDEDIRLTIRGLLKSPISFITVNPLVPYAGTPLFEKVRDDIEFSLFPYRCRFKDAGFGAAAEARKRRIYLRFYLRPILLWRELHRFLRYPLRSLRLLMILPGSKI